MNVYIHEVFSLLPNGYGTFESCDMKAVCICSVFYKHLQGTFPNVSKLYSQAAKTEYRPNTKGMYVATRVTKLESL